MPEYHILRVLVAIGAALIAWATRSSTAKIVPIYWTCVAVGMAIPQMLWAEWWKIGVSAPRECFLTLLAALVTVEAICMTLAPKQARQALLGWSAALSVALCLVAWKWTPERAFQAVMIGRQYGALIVALSGSIALAWVRWIRPTPSVLDLWWVGWTWTLVALAITTKGGLLWSVAEWKGGLETWRTVCDVALLGQVGLLGWRITEGWRVTK